MKQQTSKQKMDALKAFLKENNVKFLENYHSNFGVTMDIMIPELKIAVFVSHDDKKREDAIYNSGSCHHKMRWIYKPFFVRDSESAEFILEKMQNCIVDRMVWLQKCWEKRNRKVAG